MRQLIALALLLPSAMVVAGGGEAACAPTITDGWVRMAPGMPMGAAFAVLRNPCARGVEVVGASSPAFGDVSLHETRIEGGMSRMRAVPRLPLAAGGSAELRPGGLHVMLMAPRAEGARPTRVRVEFLLADGRRIAADLPVRATAP